MNKTVSVNIGGIVFHIEEYAYEKLKNYLESIRSHFTVGDGRDEIIQDIESRIAEIFQQYLGSARQVVTMNDVTNVMEIMGKPEDFVSNEEPHKSTKEQDAYAGSEQFFKRRLYRDTDDKVIAGVCSGIGYRLGIDAVWIRLIFVLVFFFGGGGLLVYIILAIILPKAVTPTQKLEMRGDPVNISSIRRESENPVTNKQPSAISGFFETIGDIIKVILKFFVYLIMAVFAFAGLMILFAIGLVVMAMLGVGGLTIPLFISDQFLSGSQQWWATIAFILLIAVPAIWLLLLLIKWIFRINYSNRLLNVTAGLLFLAGVIIGFFTAIDVAREFTNEGKVRNTVPLITPTAETIYLKLMDDPKYDDENNVRIFNHSGRNFSITTGSNMVYNTDNVHFTIQKSPTDQFELVQIFSSNGATEREAVETAHKINYNFEQRDSTIMFSSHFPLPKGSKFRDQKVRLILKVPVGKSVYLDESMEEIINDIDNVTNTWDGDMGGHFWKMTDAGLICTDYDFKANKRSSDIFDSTASDDVDIKIDQHGVRINGKETGHDGKDVKINIDKNGVQVKSSKSEK